MADIKPQKQIVQEQQQMPQQQIQQEQLVQNKQEILDNYVITTSDGMFMYRRIIKADDSCLFNCIGLALKCSLNESSKLREVIAKIVRSDPINFNEAILGKSPEEYAQFISGQNSWGGAIELMIFADQLECEIVAVDIINIRYDIFGQVYIMIYVSRTSSKIRSNFTDLFEQISENTEIRVFSPSDEQTLQESLKLAKLLNSKKQYTDTSKFSLQCGICFQGLTGQNDAMDHASKTGHMNFVQMT
ncbi:ubiquitin thioesterase otu1 [Stylonychia lemnae]|uniref:Ubiquitin thioesterase OTU n=1 Tax=Stylonychia lemnae TaxID=5949 RepID=A0A078B5I9_STYLE|nr:ubiquitin thioesterase otu1 [Stylonychia lemnae]CDW89790.1 ubiquitin thioesterase otu1 [Stylonychia lemnae]|eukprot:CDW86261.1 ubiquitin thioesterase otu1 [Stylonychia lemnae]